MRFSTSLFLSKKLHMYRTIIFHGKPFDVGAAARNIVERKSIKEQSNLLVITNIKHCLHALRLVNVVRCKLIDGYQKVSFDKGSEADNALLERLWTNMMPNVKRSRVFVSEEWGELGFQGKDPTTDFRGMGLLGLEQLVYFSEKRTEV
jgi:hypothetical protein